MHLSDHQQVMNQAMIALHWFSGECRWQQ